MANSEPESGPYNPPPGEFVRFEDGRTTVQFRGLVAFEWIAPKVQFWGSIAARFTAAPVDELADAWVQAAREIVAMAPPSFEFPRDAKTQEQLARRGEPLQPEMILSPGLIREILERQREAREQSEAPQEPPALPSAFGAHYGERMAPEDALRWLRLAVRLVEARGEFTAEHQLAGAELAGLAAVEFKDFTEWEAAPKLEAGIKFLEARRKEREAKQPARMAAEIRDAEICKQGRELIAAGRKTERLAAELATKFDLSPRRIQQILSAGGIRVRKPGSTK